jgi:hypothetical protein
MTYTETTTQASFFTHVDEALKKRLDRAPSEVETVLYGFKRRGGATPKKAVDSFTSAQTEFVAELAEKGLHPIAVLPKDLWESICRIADLFRFEGISKEGRVSSELPGLYGRFALMAVLTGFFVIVGLIFSFMVPQSVESTWLANFWRSLGHGFLTIAAFGCLVGISLRLYGKKKSAAFGWAKLIVGEKSERWPRILWPDGVANNKSYELIQARVTFKPKAPEEFLSTMEKIDSLKVEAAITNNYKICIAAVPEAFEIVDFEMSPERGIKAAINNLLDWSDPILYIKHHDRKKNLVAILGHFGNFPKEQEVLEFIEKEYSVINMLN